MEVEEGVRGERGGGSSCMNQAFISMHPSGICHGDDHIAANKQGAQAGTHKVAAAGVAASKLADHACC